MRRLLDTLELFRFMLGLLGLFIVFATVWSAVNAPGPETKAGPPTLSVHHERTSTVRSRCDECPQPGDVIKARIQEPSSMVRGISVYRDEGCVKSCFGCDDLSTTADLLGHYLVVGFQMNHADSCVSPCGDRSSDVVALQRCGAVFVTSEVVVR